METLTNIKSTIEAILFASGEAISINVVATSLDVSIKELTSIVEELKQEYADQKRGLSIVIMNNMVQMCTHEAYGEIVEDILSPIRSEKLTKSAIEVLSIIAYRQPVTRTEVAEIRGVRSDYLILSLLKKGMIEKVGFKDTLGKPSTFGTTELFLRDFNLKDITQLPQLDDTNEEVDIMELTASDVAIDDTEETTEGNDAEQKVVPLFDM